MKFSRARHLSMFTYVYVPEQALGWFPLDLGLVMEDEPSKCSCNQDRCNLKHIESVAAPATYMYECTVNFNQEIFQTKKFCNLQYYFPNKCNQEFSINFEIRKCWYNKINTRTYFLCLYSASFSRMSMPCLSPSSPSHKADRYRKPSSLSLTS